jgi:hypothetical protein
MKKILLGLLLALFALPAFAQATYPTAAGSRVSGVVTLTCDANGANCAPGGDAAGIVVQPGLSATHWAYAAAASGLTNTTTAVTVKAAAGAGIRNCITSLQILHPALGAASEVAVRDGAGGAVLWRGIASTAAAQQAVTPFPVPICGTANTLLEVVTLTATVTGGVYVNVQGFTRP